MAFVDLHDGIADIFAEAQSSYVERVEREVENKLQWAQRSRNKVSKERSQRNRRDKKYRERERERERFRAAAIRSDPYRYAARKLGWHNAHKEAKEKETPEEREERLADQRRRDKLRYDKMRTEKTPAYKKKIAKATERKRLSRNKNKGIERGQLK